MQVRRIIPAIAFFAGILFLEASGSLLHALILKDIPAELIAKGVDLRWMLSRDLLLASLGGIIFFIASLRRTEHRHAIGALLLGIGFGLALEGLNWVMPGALLTPVSVAHALVAWGYFVGGAMLATWVSTHPKGT